MSFQLFARLNVARKMVFAFGIVCLLCVILGAVSAYSIYRVNQSTQEIAGKWLPSIDALSQLRIHLSDARRTEFIISICTNDACLKRNSQSRLNHLAMLQESQDRYRAIATKYGDAEFCNEIDQWLAEYRPLSQKVVDTIYLHDLTTANDMMGTKSGPVYDHVLKAVEKNIIQHRKGAEEATAAAEQTFRTVKILIFVMVLLIVGASAMVGRALTSAICTPLHLASEMLERVANKDLRHTLTITSQDELGQMAGSLNTTVAEMANVLGAVTFSAIALASATAELAENASQLSNQSTTLSHQVQQVAATSTQMSATIDEISTNAEQAARASREAVSGAEKGGRVMAETAETMNRIAASNTVVCDRISGLGERSKQIGTVITVIHEIAEQTNLLALNAAIESARAGEHGRGFAVVSSEVRRLAERAAQSAQKIAGMIQSIQNEMTEIAQIVESGRVDVKTGIERMSEAREAVGAIVGMAQNSEQMVTMIATAAHQESIASSEVSQTISKVSDFAQNTVDSAGNTATACRQLGELTDGLRDVVNHFQLGS